LIPECNGVHPPRAAQEPAYRHLATGFGGRVLVRRPTTGNHITATNPLHAPAACNGGTPRLLPLSHQSMGVRLILVLVVASASLSGATAPCTCSKGVLPPFSVADTAHRLDAHPQPARPPGARIEGYTVLEVIVAADGRRCCVSAPMGHPLLVLPLATAIRRWCFKPGAPFIGVIVVRYSSSGYQLL
jgi:hypothetical protein